MATPGKRIDEVTRRAIARRAQVQSQRAVAREFRIRQATVSKIVREQRERAGVAAEVRETSSGEPRLDVAVTLRVTKHEAR